ncbi:MAG: hypothetical protein F9K16_05365 [Thermoanaerobaculia bacterium]|nr:MAG: hypothetical protein F9K16_05365 [Thermoanaerobaculia bacterium]MBZ0100827.1 transposase [Thermoanaerobaculia bacterium]
MFGLACGYADTNDARRLREDPIQKLLLGRDPVAALGLADQSTLSRFENSVGRGDLYRMGSELMDVVIEGNRGRLGSRRVKWITIDLDPTEDATHGQQQLALFNGHYDTWCYLPLLAFVTFDDEPEQHLVAAILRGGRAAASAGALPLLRRLLPRLRVRLRALGCAFVSTVASRVPRCSSSSTRNDSSTSSRSAETPC